MPLILWDDSKYWYYFSPLAKIEPDTMSTPEGVIYADFKFTGDGLWITGPE